ncbi:MAG: regulator [Methylobacter sp.]|nr:MAG: regulator [Methylobacter sp.]
MSTPLQFESTLTDRYQTTIPETVRRALKIGKRDKLQYTLQANGAVLLTRGQETNGDDPVLGDFLQFLANDMVANPTHLQPVSESLLDDIQTLTSGIQVDLDAPLAAEDE